MSQRYSAILASLFFTTLVFTGCSGDSNSTSCEGDCENQDSSESPDQDVAAELDGENYVACSSNDDCDLGFICDPTLQRCTPACEQDRECGPREVCESASGICVEGEICSSSDDCNDGLACDSCVGVCRVSTGGDFCQQNANCGFDQYCDPCLHECRNASGLCGECFEDYQCGVEEDLCVSFASGGNYCGQNCGSGLTPCPIGYRCNEEVDQCVPNSGSCSAVIRCQNDTECSGVQICSPSGQCVDGCNNDEACAGSNVCSGGRCLPPCSSTEDCSSNEECDETGHCGIPGGCSTSHDCLMPETYCDRSVGMCVDGCQEDVDCLDATMECVSDACQTKGCRGNYSCAYGQVCALNSGLCEEPTGPFCDTCDGSDIHSCGEENLCMELRDSEDTDRGDFCLVACSEDPNNLCPQGYGCREIDVDGTIYPICIRACYSDPV